MTELEIKIRDARAELEQLKAEKDAIKAKALEHRDSLTDEEVSAATEAAKKMASKISTKETEIAELESRNEKIIKEKIDMTPTTTEKRDAILKEFAERRRITVSAEEIRSTLLSTGGIAKPTIVNGIGDPLNTEISIVDQVRVIDATGAGTFKESFLDTYSSASAKTDGTAQSGSDPAFGTVTLSPSLIGVTSYVSRELAKSSPLNYAAKVQQSALTALRVKLAQDIVTKIKSATDDADSPAAMYQTLTASTANGLLASSAGAIGANTLRQIVFNYGGDANCVGGGVLYLNKTDLVAFGDVRGTNEKKAVYEITPDAANPNTGIIKDGGLAVRYCIVPTLTAHAGTAQHASNVKQTMIYGSPLNYELALFGGYEIRVSEDYKFAEGLNTVLGEVMCGGNVIVRNGFVVVTIPHS